MDRISTIRECYVIYCLWVRSVDGTGYLYLRGYSPASLTNLSQETYYNNVATTTFGEKDILLITQLFISTACIAAPTSSSMCYMYYVERYIK